MWRSVLRTAPSRAIFIVLASTLGFMATGCAASGSALSQTLEFPPAVSPPSASKPAPSQNVTLATTSVARSEGRSANSFSSGTYLVDAMVGRVAGREVYASSVFQAIGVKRLKRMGSKLPRSVFRKQVAHLIESRLREIVTDAVILAHARRNLSEKKRRAMRLWEKKQRERLIARYGAGVRAAAERTLRKKTGHGLAREIELRRRRLLIQRYVRRQIKPRVHVTRREVRRYYANHDQRYRPPPKVTIRLILVSDKQTAKQVSRALEQGTPFAQVAREHSRIRAKQGGKMGPYATSLESFSALRWDRLNQYVRKLEPGEHSPAVHIDSAYAWVQLVEVEHRPGTPLEQVFLEIERKLRNREINRLSRKHLSKLLSGAAYTSLDRMGDTLLNIAMARYGQEEEQSALAP